MSRKFSHFLASSPTGLLADTGGITIVPASFFCSVAASSWEKIDNQDMEAESLVPQPTRRAGLSLHSGGDRGGNDRSDDLGASGKLGCQTELPRCGGDKDLKQDWVGG